MIAKRCITMAETQNSTYFAMTRMDMASMLPHSLNSVLDVGCGHGNFGKHLKQCKLAREVWGVEIDALAAENARKNLDKVLLGDISHILPELPEGYFDAVFFNDSLEHMPDPSAVLLKIQSKLGKQGSVFISLPNMRYIRVLFELIVLRDWKYADSGIMDRTHLRFFTVKSMKRMFIEAGFKVELVRGVSPIRAIFFWCILLASFGLLKDTLYRQYAWRLRIPPK
jgi:2-polyprenyl-3-methyl-5-hydroxy-6-metoxy-1,4-benzoquinol methylase